MSQSKRTKSVEPAQIKIRLSPDERETLGRMIERAEKAGGLSKGTITIAGYAKSVLLEHLEQDKGKR